MVLKLYNTLTRKKEEFKPIDKKLVKIYSCGPTVYNFAHIGNFRAYIAADLLKRYLKYKGFKVKHVMNITDVDDKTIKNSQKERMSLKEFTEKYAKIFFEDIDSLNIERADVYPKATETIKEMVELVQKLLDKGIAYKSEDGSIYYSISKFNDYGKLAKLDMGGLKEGARVKHDEYEKEAAYDFALWKGYNEEDGDVFWETSIGKGRPGWHIECSAMSTKFLGQPFDIHTGGVDLVFPHHTNEIAQSEGAYNKKFAQCWFHNEHLLVDNKKMSKSLGNFFTLRDLLDNGHKPMALRYELLATHYRQKLNFTEEAVKAADNGVERLNEFVRKLKGVKRGEDNTEVKKLIEKVKKKFEEVMDDDLNISEGLAVVFDFVREINKLDFGVKDAKEALSVMNEFNSVLGVINFEEEELDDNIQILVDERENARKEKNYSKADKIRDDLKAKGVVLEDTPDGVRWKKI